MELSRFLRPSILKFDDWFINVSIGGTGGEDSNIQKDVYFSGKNAYLYASTGSGATELHIFGNSVQDGTPSIENPVPIISVGENYLQLYSLDINDPSKSGQIIDFGNIKLRSLPNGVCDEIVYQNGQWKHIQRIVSIIIDKNTTIQDQLAASNRVTIQVNYTLITKASANNTNLCSKISNSASSVPRFHNYPNTIYLVWNSNKPATFEEAKSLIMGAEFCCELAEPIETILDLPKLQTLNGTTYLLTNDQQVKPYLQGYYDVDLKVSGKKLEYAQDGLIGWWQPFGLTNADKPTVIPDKLGNSDLTIKNIGYTNESGFNPTYLQLDGIDDYLTNIGNFEPEHIKHMQVTLSNLFKESATSYWFSIFDKDGTDFQGIADDRHLFGGPSDVTVVSFLNGVKKKGINASYFKEIYDNNSDDIYCLGIQNNVDAVNFTALNIGTIKDSISYISKERFYEAIAYNRALTDEEVQSNFLVSQIRNGINIPNDIDPIDIISTPTYGSGKAFPVYNTYIDRNNNNVESLIICGYTEQDGTPTPENPIELKSVGDQSLVLCIYNEDKSKVQYIDFGDIVLRSLPDGTCDSIEWDGTQWKYIQRIEHIYIDGNINITKIVNNTNLNICYVNIPVSIVNGQNVKPYSSMYCNRKLYRKNGYNIADSIFTVDANTYFYITYLNDTGEPYTSDDIKAINDEYPLDIYYAINEPIETILEDLPAPQTYDQVTYFSTPNTEVRPYIMATVKAIKPLEYQGDISAWWYFGGNKSNATDRGIIDLSGNGNNLTPLNFAWNKESGWNQGSIHADGIDDFISLTKNINVGDIFICISNIIRSSNNIQYVLNNNIANTNKWAGIIIDEYDNINVNDDTIASLVPNNISAIPTNHLRLKYIVEEPTGNVNLFNMNGGSGGNYKPKGNVHECLFFSTELTTEQTLNNKKLITQRNGIEDHVNFTAIASGKKFPIYYTIEGDTIKELHIYGESMQEGTPTIDTPQEIYSSGDEGLKLCVTDSETNTALQIIDFGDIVLRSLPSGVCDEIVYRDKQWRYIQRVYHIHISNAYYHNTTAKFAMVNLNPTYGGLHNNQNYVMSNRFIIGSFENMSNNIGISYINAVNSTYAFNFENEPGTNDHVQEWLANNPTELIYQLAEPIETVLDLPDITTYADITYIGTPNAKVKPYIECVAETYKSLEFVKDGLVELYDFAPSKWQDNKIYNEIDNSQYITANNFNNTVESGAFSNYTQFDGIDDYFDNDGSVIAFVQIYAKDFVFNPNRNSWIFAGSTATASYNGLKIDVSDGNILSEVGKISMDDKEQADYISQSEWSIGIHSYQLFYLKRPFTLSRIGQFINGAYYTKFKLYNLLAYSTELTTEQIANNLNCFKQFKGVDGDINIIPEPEVYYDFSLYNNTDFPTTIENLATDKSKALQLFNFAGTEESGFFEGALVSDGVDDYAIIQNQTEGFKTVFLDVINLSTNTFIYDQRTSASNSVETNTFGIFTTENSIAYNERNSGLTYIDGVQNDTLRCKDLTNKRNVITVTNNIVTKNNSKTPIFFKNALSNGYFAKVHIRKFLGFKEALTAEQIQEVINQYFSESQLLDSQGNELTDSQGYYLTVAS